MWLNFQTEIILGTPNYDFFTTALPKCEVAEKIVAVPLALAILGVLLSLLRRIGLDLGSAPGVLLLLGLPIALLATSMKATSSRWAR